MAFPLVPLLGSLIGRMVPTLARSAGTAAALGRGGAATTGGAAGAAKTAGTAASSPAGGGLGQFVRDFVQGTRGRGGAITPTLNGGSGDGGIKGLFRDVLAQAASGPFGRSNASPSSGGPAAERPVERAEPRRRFPSASDLTFAAPQKDGVIQQAQQHFADKRKQAEEETKRQLESFGAKLNQATLGLFKTAGWLMKLNFISWGLAKSLELFAGTVSESRRHLAQWDGGIAASFARLDISQMQRDIRTAQGTSGSTTALNAAYDDLLREMQPIRQDIATVMNGVGIAAAKVGQVAAMVMKWLPVMGVISFLARQIEGNTRKPGGDTDPMRIFLDMLKNQPKPGPAPPPDPIKPKPPLPPLV